MIKLTNEEKAARYDSLQVAIKYTTESYRRLRDDSDKRFSEARDVGLIGAYNKGFSDACCRFLVDLERWAE